MCPVVMFCIVDATLSQYVGKSLFLCFTIIKCASFNLVLIVNKQSSYAATGLLKMPP